MTYLTWHVFCTLTDWLNLLCHLSVYFPPLAWVLFTLFNLTLPWVLLWLGTITWLILMLDNNPIHRPKEFPQLLWDNYDCIFGLDLLLLILRISIPNSSYYFWFLPLCQQIINCWVFTKYKIRSIYVRVSRNYLSRLFLLSSVTIERTWTKPSCSSPLKKYEIDL